MKYIIPQDKLDKVIFTYLDLNLRGLVKNKAYHYHGIIIGYPNDTLGMFGWNENDNVLYIFAEIIYDIYSFFGLQLSNIESSDIKSSIGRWVSDRFQLKVDNTQVRLTLEPFQNAR